jgi:acetyltransferase-like isoleucine patch superfamily enzyme
MALRRIEFTPEFVNHLALLGLHGVRPGAFAVDDASAFEPPADLRHAWVWGAPLEIGAFSYLGPDVFCTGARLGRYCSIAKLVQIGLSTHPADRLTSSPLSWKRFEPFESHFRNADLAWERTLPAAPFDERPITAIGNDVWIGANAYIKDGVTIGDGAIVGAHAVVTRDVPAYAIAVGNPARVIRMRFDDATVERMQAVAWWRFNLLDLDIDLTDPARALDAIEAAVAAGLEPYATAPINLHEEHKRFRKAQRLLGREAA